MKMLRAIYMEGSFTVRSILGSLLWLGTIEEKVYVLYAAVVGSTQKLEVLRTSGRKIGTLILGLSRLLGDETSKSDVQTL